MTWPQISGRGCMGPTNPPCLMINIKNLFNKWNQSHCWRSGWTNKHQTSQNQQIKKKWLKQIKNKLPTHINMALWTHKHVYSYLVHWYNIIQQHMMVTINKFRPQKHWKEAAIKNKICLLASQWTFHKCDTAAKVCLHDYLYFMHNCIYR